MSHFADPDDLQRAAEQPAGTAQPGPHWVEVEAAPPWRDRRCPDLGCTARFDGRHEYYRFQQHWNTFHTTGGVA
jgi:hypothetical protein